MRMKVFAKVLIPYIFAFAGTGGLYWADKTRSEGERVEFSLRLVRQTLNQIDTLKEKASQRGESEPLAWAIQTFALGPEDRPIQVAPFHVTPDSQEVEKYRLNPKTGAFTYAKILDSTKGFGIRVHVLSGFVGFLGARTLWLSDLSVVAVFIGFLIFGILFMRNAGNAKTTGLDLHLWLDDSKNVLTKVGASIRDVTLEAHSLACATAQARDKVYYLMNEASPILKELSLEMDKAVQSGGKDLFKLNEMIRQLKRYADRIDQDCAAASASFDKVFNVTTELNGHITRTKESLIEETQLMQDLKQGLSR